MLWRRATTNPEECCNIVRFSDLHDGMKYVKDRGMEVLARNYDMLGLGLVELSEKFGGGERGKALEAEFILHLAHRVEGPFFEKVIAGSRWKDGF